MNGNIVDELENPITSSYEHNGLRIEITVKCHTIDTVAEAFENVLRGAGYNFDGCFELVKERKGAV